MAPLLTTLETAQSDFDLVNSAYEEASGIVEGGDRDASGELLPDSDQSEDW